MDFLYVRKLDFNVGIVALAEIHYILYIGLGIDVAVYLVRGLREEHNLLGYKIHLQNFLYEIVGSARINLDSLSKLFPFFETHFVFFVYQDLLSFLSELHVFFRFIF